MKPLICIDIGAGSLKLAEFAVQSNGTLDLLRYAIKALPKVEDVAEAKVAYASAIEAVLKEQKIRGRGLEVNLCLPSHQVFSKALRTPPVEGAKVGQIIQYEAQENVPFPLDEVRWDYQVLGTADTGELDVLLMAVKKEVVEAATDVCRQMRLKLQIIDGSITSLRNAFLHNYGQSDETSLLMSIGARSTNVLFIRGSAFYARTISIGSQAITESFAAEAQITLEQAEQFKIEHGYVHLGGPYEESQDPYQAIVSKAARNTMTRLHQQVAQTLQFYKTQGGKTPARMYLAGGGGTLPYTADFFKDKLQMEVEYFNPFQNIKVGDAVDVEALGTVAHTLGELVGLGLRNVTVGLTEFNLLAQREQISREVDRRSPYAIAAVFCAGLIFLVLGVHDWRLAATTESVAKDMEAAAPAIPALVNQINAAVDKAEAEKTRADALLASFDGRYIWIKLLNALGDSLRQIEPHVKIVGFRHTNNAPRSILRMDQLPAGLDPASVRPWKEITVETNALFHPRHGFAVGTPLLFHGAAPLANPAVNAPVTNYVGGVSSNSFTLHRTPEDARANAKPVEFTESPVEVLVNPVTGRLSRVGHPFRDRNVVRFNGAVRPGIARPVSVDTEYFVNKVSEDAFTLHTGVPVGATNLVQFAAPGRSGLFEIVGGVPAASNATRAPPQIDLATHQVLWPKHGLEQAKAIKFNGLAAGLPEASASVAPERLFHVRRVDPNTFTLHTQREATERNQIIFTADPQIPYSVSGVPGYFALDSPRPADAQLASSLNSVVGVGGTYAMERESGRVTYISLAGNEVPRNLINEQVLQQLNPLRDLKHLDVWLNPDVKESEQPEFFKSLETFRKNNVPDCSINLAVPVAIWVSSLSPPEIKPQAAPKPGTKAAPLPAIKDLALRVRFLSLETYYTDANLHFSDLAVKTIGSHPYFGGVPVGGATGTRMEGNMQKVTDKDKSFLFEFDMTLVLGRPIPLQEGASGTVVAAGGAAATGAPAGGALPPTPGPGAAPGKAF